METKEEKARKLLKQYVVQSNDLIKYIRYDLTAIQRKLIYEFIAMIKPNETPDAEYTLSIPELCTVLGYEKSGTKYQEIAEQLKEIRDKSFWLRKGNGIRETVSFFSSITIDDEKNEATVLFDDTIVQYIFNLNGKYTQFMLNTAIAFSSKYTIDLHELLLAYSGKLKDINYKNDNILIDFTVEEFKERLGVYYDRWFDIERQVIKKAIYEINLYSSDIKILKYDIERKGKIPYKIIFTVARKGYIEKLDAEKLVKQETEIKPIKKPGRPKKKENTEEERRQEIYKIINLTFEEARNIFDISKKIQEETITGEQVILTDEQKELLESASKKMAEIKEEEIEKIQKEIRKCEKEAKKLEKMPDNEEKKELIRQNNIDLENKRMILEKYKKLDELEVEKN